MESNEPTYTPEELAEIYLIIFLDITDEEMSHNGRILMDKNAFCDQETLIKYLNKEIASATEIRRGKKIVEFTEVQEILFCDKKDMPLYINHRLSRVMSWRLDHGK